MDRQMDIFDFIEKPPESEQRPPRTQFEQLFERVRDPVCLCANCDDCRVLDLEPDAGVIATL